MRVGLEKVALILMMIEPDIAGSLLRLMTESERKQISEIMSNLGIVSKSDYNKALEKALEFMDSNSDIVGNQNNTKELFLNVLGEDDANEILTNLESDIWDKLSRVDSKLLFSYLDNEHPQTVAFVLSCLESTAASRIISLFSQEKAENIVLRLTNIGIIAPEVTSLVEQALHDDWYGVVNRNRNSDMVFNILDNLDKNSEEKFIKAIEKQNKDLAQAFRKDMLSFDELEKFSDADVQILLKELDKDKLVIALKAANENLSSLIFKNMSERAARIMKGDIDSLGPLRRVQVEEAQSYVARVAKQLIKDGLIVFGEETL